MVRADVFAFCHAPGCAIKGPREEHKGRSDRKFWFEREREREESGYKRQGLFGVEACDDADSWFFTSRRSLGVIRQLRQLCESRYSVLMRENVNDLVVRMKVSCSSSFQTKLSPL
jgi:hypothetical protein